MKLGRLQALCELAQRHRILPEYLDMAGARQEAVPEALQAILGALGVPAGNPAEISESLHETELRDMRRRVEPVIVAWDKRPVKIRLHVPDGKRAVQCRLRLEHCGGESSSLHVLPPHPALSPIGGEGGVAPGERDAVARFNARSVSWISLKTRKLRTVGSTVVGNTKYLTIEIRLPSLPLGYHDLEIETNDGTTRALIISASEKTYAEPRLARQWGVFAPMYAVHSEQSWGAGNFSDWSRFADWIGSLGGNVAATLPLLSQFLDHPVCEPSPYSAASRLFWNEFHIDVTEAPEFAGCAAAQRLAESRAFQSRLNAFREHRFVDYAAEWKARREVLELLAEDFFRRRTPRFNEFSKVLGARPQLEDYARFRAVCDLTKKSWRNWPARLRDGNLCSGNWRETDRRFHLYAQWIAQEQIERLVEHTRRSGVSLNLDLPLGVNADGYDLWRYRDQFVLDASAGAPPDMFFTKGQDWGFSPLHPERIRETGYRYVRELFQFHMRHAGLLRMDHIMGLHRLFWIPRGFAAAQGAYVSYHAEEWYAILSLESHRHKTMLVGENLGTVPPEVNESMRRHRVRETYVVQYEQRPDARRPLRPPPALSFASANTHDMPTFAAHWSGGDIEDRRRLGLIPHGKVAREKQNRRELNNILAKFLSTHGFLKTRKLDRKVVLRALLNWLGKSDAQFVIMNLEDLWLEKLPQNVPGTSTERPNWRRKARMTLEEIKTNAQIAQALRQIRRLTSNSQHRTSIGRNAHVKSGIR